MLRRVVAFVVSLVLITASVLSPIGSFSAKAEQGTTLMTFAKMSSAITVDGYLTESEWDLGRYAVTNRTEGNASNNTVHFDAKWNNDYLYVAVKVVDSQVVNNNQLDNSLWKDDTIEIFIDGNGNKGVGYDEFDAQIFVRALDSKVYTTRGNNPINLMDRVIAETQLTGDGYTVEVAIPWADLNVVPKSGMIIGFDVANDDCDEVGEHADRSSALTWNNKAGNNYATTSNFGNLMLIANSEPLVSREGTPSIDGELSEWNLDQSMINNDNQISFGSLCDKNYLYVAVEVMDVAIVTGSALTYKNDGIEVYFDGNNAKTTFYESDDRQFSIGPGHELTAGFGQSLDGVISFLSVSETGYILELAVPWTNLGVTPKDGITIGFDLVNIDNDNGIDDDVSWGAWSGDSNNWQSTANFGNILVKNPNVKRDVYSGPRGTIEDAAEDFSKVESATSGIFITGEGMFNTWNADQTLVYKSLGDDIVEFEILTKEMDMPIEIYSSPDNISYTKLSSSLDYKVEVVIPASGDTGWYAYLKYKSIEIPEGTRYIKLAFLTDGSNGFRTHIDNVKIDYKLTYNGRRLTFVDEATDFSKLLTYTDIYIGYDSDFETSKFFTWTSNGALIYQSPSGSILSFAMEVVEGPGFAADPAFEVYGSKDGIDYKRINLTSEVVASPGWWELKRYTAPSVDWGYQYIKILYKTEAGDSWAASVVKVMFDCAFENNVPKVRDINVMTQVNTPIQGNLGAYDADEEDVLTYLMKIEPTSGSVSLDELGNYTYTPNADYVGYDHFEIEVSDGQGGIVSSTVKVYVNYAATNLTYYVNAEDGIDTNTGLSEAAAFATIQAAHDVSKPGDTILIMNGTYGQTSGEGAVNITRSGLPEAYITYKAYPGHYPVLTVEDAWNHIRVSGAAYIIIDGLTIIGNQDTINEEQALATYNYMVEKVTNNDWGTIDWGYLGKTNTNGIFIATGGEGREAHHIVIKNMDISKCPGGGIGSSYADYITIENNKVYDNCKWSIFGNSGISIYNGFNYDYSKDKYKNVIQNNESYNNVQRIKWFQVQAMSDGNGIIVDDTNNAQKAGAEPYEGWTLVQNNLTYGNGGSGIHAYSSSNVDIINNTSYMNNVIPELNWGEIYSQSGTNVTIMNNILYGRGRKLNEIYGNTNVVYDYNIYFNGTPMVQGPNDRIVDPKFVDPSVANFRLRSDSPAIDAAFASVAPERDITGALRNIPDIGAFEYVGAGNGGGNTDNNHQNTPSIKPGTSSIDIDMSTTNFSDKTMEVIIPILAHKSFNEILNKDLATVTINVKLPNSAFQNDNLKLVLEKEVLAATKSAEKDIRITIQNTDGKERYSWIFKKEELLKSKNDITDVNLLLTVKELDEKSEILKSRKDKKDVKGIVVNFAHNGVLPAQATVRVFVGKQEEISQASKVYVYYYNSETGKLETLPFSSNYKVDQDGYISINILHCSDYVILSKQAEASQITSLRKQVAVTPSKKTLYVGDSKSSATSIQIALPSTLEIVSSLKDKTSQTAIGGVVVNYRSNNEKVATVDKEGKITAKGVGTANIITTITLYSGKIMAVKTSITVKEPYIKLTNLTKSMKVGDSFTFKADAYGLEANDIVWSTTEKSIVVIDKNTGKATAKSVGTDYVVAKIGNKSIKIKVVVN